MEVLLVKPPYEVAPYYGLGKRFVAPALAEATLAAWLEKQGLRCTVLDCHREEMSWSDLAVFLSSWPAGLIGVSASMACYHNDYIRFIKLAKEVLPGSKVVAGGGHFGLIPEEVFQDCPELDFLVIGEGEMTLMDLMRALDDPQPDLNKIPGLAFKQNGQLVINEPRDLIEDLDILPNPAMDIMELENNHFSLLPEEWGKWIMLVTERGCVSKCNFCTARLSQGRYRGFSAERIMIMLREAYDRGCRAIWIDDLGFNIDRRRTERFVDLMSASDMSLKMTILSKTDFICRDEKILHKYKAAGIEMVMMGGESPLEKDLERYQKGSRVDALRKSIELLREHEIASWVFFMIGELEHSREDVIRILEFADELDVDIPVFSIVTPLPGTSYFHEMKAAGVIEVFDYRAYDMTQAVMRTKHLSREEITSAQQGGHFLFYGKPGRIERKLQSPNSFVRNWYHRLKRFGEFIHIHGQDHDSPLTQSAAATEQ